MLTYTVNGVTVKVMNNGYISEDEALAYVDRGVELYGKGLYEIIVTLDSKDPDMVDLEYKWKSVTPFHRLRRITGYLVGSVGRWNNGKRAELRDRVKHGTEESHAED